MRDTRLRVLVVEDDAAMAAGIVRGLEGAGLEVELVTNGVDATRRALTREHDIVVLDLLLPGQSGVDVLEQLQGRGAPPVIVLTARSDLSDRLRCFALGAADFLAKPFWIEELVARIRSRLQSRDEAPKRVVRFAGVAVDLDARRVSVGGAPVSLTRYEIEILAHLVERPGRAVSRRQLAERALTPLDDRDDRTIDSHIARIRKKIGAPAATSILTVWGIGYRFEPPSHSEAQFEAPERQGSLEVRAAQEGSGVRGREKGR